MVPMTSLWLPILLSAVFVFILSSIIHMVLPYHRSDYQKLPSEDAIMDALGKFDIPPGDYLMPCPPGPNAMNSPDFVAKRNKGPVAIMTFMKPGTYGMGKNLIEWFLYSVLVSILASYVASRALGPGAPYLAVFRFVGTTAFIAYTIGGWQSSIWYSRKWSTTFKNTFDGLLYGLVTAGTFGWLWPN